MPVDAAIHDQRRSDHGLVLAGLGKLLREQRHFECAWHIETHHFGIEAQLFNPRLEPDKRLIDDIGVPAGLDESNFEGFCHCSDPFNNDKIPERTSVQHRSRNPLPHTHSLPSGP